ncbi:O-antigen ligase family protein [Bradyrhizobium sp. B117]|uniref:O-antigen ligase family protein n=1 Tax=Bradyrhizobium sp. B117 TaxID=3140246 RepID=UPI003183FA1E
MIGEKSENLGAIILCSLVVLAPLPFGSTVPQIVAVEVLLLSLVLTLASLTEFSARDAKFVGAFALVGLCWLLVVAAQLVPNGGAYFHLNTPVWSHAGHLLGVQLPTHISIVRDQPWIAAGSQIACAASLLAGYLVGRNRFWARVLLLGFASSGLLYAIFGIAMTVWAPNNVLWMEKAAYRGVLTATFVNANTAAIYFGLCSVLWLLLAAKDLDQYVSLRAALVQPPRRAIVCLISFLITLSAAFMTGSRAGSVLTILGLVGAATTYSWRRFGSRSAMATKILLMATAAGATFLWLGGRVSDRFDAVGFMDEARLSTYVSTMNIIRDYPWLGTGLGTFVWAFPAYRNGSTSVVGVWDRAHNTMLEIASEMGLPFSLVVILAWLTILFHLSRGMVTRKRDKIFPVFGFWASLLAVLHSQVDFPLQIPGFSIVILTLTGAGLAQSTSPRLLAKASPP